MAEIYGHRWTSSYGDSEAGTAQTWAKGLAGVSPVQLAAGLSDCIASADPWPPTLPEFRARCLGVPTLGAVRSDIATRSTPFVVKCWEFIDAHAFRIASREAGDRMVREAYEQAREFVMRGGVLPEIVAVLEAPEKPKPKPADPGVAARLIAECAELLAAGIYADLGIEVGGTNHGKAAAAGPDA